jgi:predicted deacetylase
MVKVQLEAAGFAVRFVVPPETVISETNYCLSKEDAFVTADLLLRVRYPDHTCGEACTDWEEDTEPIDLRHLAQARSEVRRPHE